MTIKHITHVQKVEVIPLIKITSSVGQGTEDDPVGWIHEYYDMKGRLLWRDDTWRYKDDFVADTADIDTGNIISCW